MRRSALVLAVACALAVAASHARAETFYLADGEAIEGTLVEETTDTFGVRLDGTTAVRYLPKDQVVRRVGDVPAPKRAPPATPRPSPTPALPELSREELGLAALKKLAWEGLGQRARLVAGAPGLRTQRPIVAGDTVKLGPLEAIDIDVARSYDMPVDDVLHDLWRKRGTTPEQRARALGNVAGAVCWVEGEVVEAKEVAGQEATDVTLTLGSPALRRQATVRRPGRVALRPHETVRLACVLVVKPDEAAEFLAARSGESLSAWPVDAVLIAAEVGGAPRTVAKEPKLLLERALAGRVDRWLKLRSAIICHACGGGRHALCPRCEGSGVIPKVFLGDGNVYPYPCPRCQGRGWHTCQLCKDGLSEMILKDSLRTFGTYGFPLAAWLTEGQSIVVDPSGTSAVVKTWIRDTPNSRPRCETVRWIVDPQFGWKPADGTN